MPKFTNTFTGGLDRDTIPTSYDNKKYYNARNFSIVVAEDLSSATLTNTKGISTKLTDINVTENRKIVGIGETSLGLVIFTKGGGFNNRKGRIHEVPFSVLEAGIVNLDSNTYLMVSNDSFRFGNRIEVIAREETPQLRKIYWVDDTNPLRFCNLYLSYSELSSYDVTKFEINQEIELSTPTYSSTISGNLVCGVYQYSYCLYNQNGTQTIYSPFSQFIQVVQNGLTTTSNTFKGSNIGTISTSGIEINIQDANTNFDYIRVVALLYTVQDVLPQVTIIYEGKRTDNLSIIHTGNELLGTITIEEAIAIPNILIPKTISSKYNYLFIGNIKEENFDIDYDARAYRFFVGENYFCLYNSIVYWAAPGTYYNYTTTTYPEIDDYDYPLSPRNVLDWDFTGNANASYQSDGSTLGGEGPNIKYRFITHDVPYQNSDGGMGIWNVDSSYITGLGGYSNPYENNFVGYQRDEIYRFGIVFFNARGQSSFVKWIGDIRFPCYSDVQSGSTLFEILSFSNPKNVKALGIEFTIKNFPVGAVSYQIVRAKRNYNDSTVVDCGYVGHLYLRDTSDLYFGGWGGVGFEVINRPNLIIDAAGVNVVKNIVEYICAETNYNKNNYGKYDRLDVFNGTGVSTEKNNANSNFYYYDNCILTSLYPLNDYNTTCNIEDTYLFVGKRDIDPDTGFYSLPSSFGSYKVHSSSEDISLGLGGGYKGTTLMLKLTENLTPNTAYDHTCPYSIRRRTTYPYGGYTDSAILNTIYYPCSNITPITTTVLSVYGGDTYITKFEYMRTMWAEEAGANNKHLQVVQCLVESKLNLNYTINDKWSTFDDNLSISSSIVTADLSYNAMWEEAGTWIFTTSTSPDTYYIQPNNLYTYNPIYSLNTSSKTFIPKPLNFSDTVTYSTRVYKSEKKVNGEIQDSWLQFLPNNYIDLDKQFGDLTRLYNHNNKLFYFQNKGFGVLPIEDREVINSSSGVPVSIGTGGVLTRYDYISTNAGTLLPNSIYGTDSSLYFVDGNLKKICKLSEEEFDYISDTEGLYSYMNNAILTTVNTTYDPKTKELHFSFNDQTTPESLTYNEYTKTFIGFSDTIFKYGIYNNGNMYIFDDILASAKYYVSCGTLESGPYGKYSLTYPVPSTYTDSTLELIINPAKNLVGRFDIVELSTEVYNVANPLVPENDPTTTFNTLRLRNNYQDTAAITLIPGTNLTRRFRTWRMNELRDTLEANNTGRMVDNYGKLSLTFINDGTNKLLVSDIQTTFSLLNIK